MNYDTVSSLKFDMQDVQGLMLEAIKLSEKVAKSTAFSDARMNENMDEFLCMVENICINSRKTIEKHRPVMPIELAGKKDFVPGNISGGIEITPENWVHITLNTLLPHCKYKTSNYLKDTIIRLLISQKGKLPKYENVFLAIVEHCNHTNRNAFDNDNKGWKMIPNALKGWLFEDDDQFHLSLGLFSKLCDEVACHIYVVPTDDAAFFIGNFIENS